MIFAALFWIAILFTIMRLLTWIAKRHPRARNPAAFVVETGAALAVAEALADVGAIAWGLGSSPKLFLNAVFMAAVAGVAHFLASNTATSAHALYPPFVLVSLATIAGLVRVPSGMLVALGTLVIGCLIGWMKYRASHTVGEKSPSHETSQA